MRADMVYEVYAGGIHAVQAKLHIELVENDRYEIKLSAKTRGFLGRVAPWQGSFESTGWRMSNGDLRPELHRSIATWRGEEEGKSYHYTKDGSFKGLEIKDFDKPVRTENPNSELTQGTKDVLTSTLEALMNVSQGNGCANDADVFDGKRRFTQKFIPKYEEALQSSRYNIYEGPSVVCTVEITPKGGAWHKKPRGWMSIQEQGREKGTMPTVWMAQVSANAPAVPIKILVKTNYGALFMHLAEYQKQGDEIIVAEKRVTEENED